MKRKYYLCDKTGVDIWGHLEGKDPVFQPGYCHFWLSMYIQGLL